MIIQREIFEKLMFAEYRDDVLPAVQFFHRLIAQCVPITSNSYNDMKSTKAFLVEKGWQWVHARA